MSNVTGASGRGREFDMIGDDPQEAHGLGAIGPAVHGLVSRMEVPVDASPDGDPFPTNRAARVPAQAASAALEKDRHWHPLAAENRERRVIDGKPTRDGGWAVTVATVLGRKSSPIAHYNYPYEYRGVANYIISPDGKVHFSK